MYEYRATIMRVVDGDTVHANVDLGFDVRIGMKLRLFGINAPEMSTAAGKEARLHLVSLLHPDAPVAALPMLTSTPAEVTIATEKDRQEKYGRYLATIFRNINVNQQMVEDGFAVPYMAGR